MIADNPRVAKNSALAELEKSGCLDTLLDGKPVKVNDSVYFGHTRGRAIVKRLRNLINQVLTVENGGLNRINAVEIDFNNRLVWMKEDYLPELRKIAASYDKKYEIYLGEN